MEVKAEQIKIVYSSAIMGLLGHFLAAILMVYFLVGHVPDNAIIIWASSILLVLVFRAIVIYLYQSQNQKSNPDFNTKRWLVAFQIGVFASGILWGSCIYFAEHYQLYDFYFLILAVGFGLAGAAISTLGPVFSIYFLFSFPMLCIIALGMILTGKPVYFEISIFNFLGLAFLNNAAYRHSNNLKESILKTREVENSQLEIIERLGTAGEYRDNETGMHIKRMSHSSFLLAKQAGLPNNIAEQILAASPMHDIGKIGIPDNILLKPGKLTAEEFEIMKSHTSMGVKILENHESDLMELAAKIAGNHHEKWDGSGYPNGLSGSHIPIEARIVSICDVFDALTSARPYKKAWSHNDALEFVRQESGKYFDPHLVEHFMEISPQVIEYTNKYQDDETDWTFWKPPE
ncbi:MAG: HD domain-containing protein [Gammaproteobacteria bacterium]|nr:HD domain-containing protein [Gammaproteobacteria bacterium]